MRKPLVNVRNLLETAKQETSCGNFSIVAEGAVREAGAVNGVADIVNLVSRPDVDVVHFSVKGEWSLHELFAAAIKQTGPAHVAISSYAMSETAARTLSVLKDTGQILSLKCVIDNRIETRTAGSLQLLRSLCSRMTLCPCHAKLTLIYNDEKCIVILGSANYTENKRFEVGFITTSRTVLNFHKNWIENALNEYGAYNP